jgi:hypothetical protein
MDIQQVSTGIAQGQVLEEAAVRVQGMALGVAEEQAAGLAKLLASAQVLSDPNLGQNLNLEG